MNVHIKWNFLIPILSSLVKDCFRDEVVKSQPYLDSFQNTYVLQNENKHQICNVHTKWNSFIPILSTLVKYYLFQA